MHLSFSLCVTYPNGSLVCYSKSYSGKHQQLQIGSVIGGWKTGNVVGEVAAKDSSAGEEMVVVEVRNKLGQQKQSWEKKTQERRRRRKRPNLLIKKHVGV